VRVKTSSRPEGAFATAVKSLSLPDPVERSAGRNQEGRRGSGGSGFCRAVRRIAGETAGEGEVLRDGGACAEIHFVRSLAVKGGVGDHGVMLLDVESDETSTAARGVEVVEEQPVVFEGAPPGLDHRIREGDFDLREDAAETSEAQEYIDVTVDVLDARIDHDGCGISTEVESSSGSGENRADLGFAAPSGMRVSSKRTPARRSSMKSSLTIALGTSLRCAVG
jgi:hypothetical protein